MTPAAVHRPPPSSNLHLHQPSSPSPACHCPLLPLRQPASLATSRRQARDEPAPCSSCGPCSWSPAHRLHFHVRHSRQGQGLARRTPTPAATVRDARCDTRTSHAGLWTFWTSHAGHAANADCRGRRNCSLRHSAYLSRIRRHSIKAWWQSGLMRKTRNLVPSGASVRIRPTSRQSVSLLLFGVFVAFVLFSAPISP